MPRDPADWRRVPGHGQYARTEVERRFLVHVDAPAGTAGRLVEDRYLDGTRLRLRRVTCDGEHVHKLTQKVRLDPADASTVLITNTYVTETEYLRLLVLPGRDVVKTRTVLPDAFVLDTFHGRWQGLRLAEVEVDALTSSVHLPAWVVREVTGDDRFSGGRLAHADAAALREVLRLAREAG